VTSITPGLRPILLSTLFLLGIALIFVACGDDDDDDDAADDTSEEAVNGGGDESDESDDSESEADDDQDDDDVNTSPSSGSEYLEIYTQIASNLADQFSEECVDAVDISNLDPSDVEIPEECQEYFDQFASQLDEVDPPDACADLHELLVDLLDSLAEGDTGALQDLIGGDDGEASEGIISASVECGGV
jgi:hypothetical protein